jgi:hypothetical protein
MSSYGRNFDFRKPPEPENRNGRFVLPTTGTPVAIGAPIQANVGVAPTALDLGTFLEPGPGADATGYWQATATAADAWLVVSNVNVARGEVEANFVF